MIYCSRKTASNSDKALDTIIIYWDRAAEYGVAGLVAGTLGVKLLKAAGAGALLIGLKKFGILIILPFIWLWRKIASVVSRKQSETLPSK
jgi:hypothetical protein